MKKSGFEFLLVFLFLRSASSVFSKDELQIIFDLKHELGIFHSIFVSDDDTFFLEIKTFSSKNIPSTKLNYNQIIKFVDETVNHHYGIGIIFKEKDLQNLEIISKILDELVGILWKSIRSLIACRV